MAAPDRPLFPPRPRRSRPGAAALLGAVGASVLVHAVITVALLVWPREPDLKPQLTIDLVDEVEPAAEATPAEAAAAKDSKPKADRPKAQPVTAPSAPEKLARVVQPQAEPERDRPIQLEVLPPPPDPKVPDRTPDEKKPPKPEEKKPEPPQPATPPKPLPPELRRMKMVDQEQEKDEAENKDAEFLAEKNRRVKEQTRATETNLERNSHGQAQGSAPSERPDEAIGGPKEKIAETAEERSHRERQAPRVTPHARDEVPEQRDPRPRHLLSMRDLKRRAHEIPGGAEPQNAPPAPDGIRRGQRDESAHSSLAPREQTAQSRGGKDLKLTLSGNDFDKVVGKDEQERNRRLAQREQSHHAGRWEKKWGAIKSSLENFIPEVRPGSQTALNTRAAPFAAFIARMHRGIHKLWGFGVLEDWDMKSSSNPLNDMARWTMLEIVLATDGTVEKVTVVRPSGYLPFDVAAMDVVLTAGPYPDPPREILSANSKIYLHWRFHRDNRQCATFGVDPYILTTPPKGPSDKPALPVDPHEVGRERGLPTPGGGARAPRALQRQVVLSDHTYRGPAPEMREAGEQHEHEEPDPAAAHSAAQLLARADDPIARRAAQAWVDAYVKGDLEALLAASRAPFQSGETTITKLTDMARLYRGLLDEAPRRRGERKLEVLTAAGLRAKLGALPRGAGDGEGTLFAVARAGSDTFVLVLKRDGAGEWRVMGIAR